MSSSKRYSKLKVPYPYLFDLKGQVTFIPASEPSLGSFSCYYLILAFRA